MKRHRFRCDAWPILTLAVASLLLWSGLVPAQDFGFAAKVNGEGITRARLQSTLDVSMHEAGMNYGGITQPSQFKRRQQQTLDQLIAQALLWQEASRQGHVATPAEVDAALDQMRGRHATQLDYLNELERNGFTEESYRENLKRHISVRRWVQESLAKNIVVRDADIHAFYTANQPRFVQSEQLRARHVLIKIDPGADEGAAIAGRQKIEEILAEAKLGADFAELARAHSQGPSAPRGGDLGFLPRGRLVKPFEDAAFALKPGEISDIVRTRYGFHIIKLEARRARQVVPEAQAAPSIREHLLSSKVQDAVEERVNDLREQGSVAVLIP